MRWQSETNYHNSRNYEEVPVPGAVSQARLTVAYVVDSVRRGLKRLVAPTPVQRPRRRPVTLIDARGFTTLGGTVAPQPIRQQHRCAFPELDDATARLRAKPVESAHWLPTASNDRGDGSSLHSRDR